MSIIIRLQNLPWSANAGDIRQYFRNLSIPDGGVHIVGGENGDAFIAFGSDEDARQAMLLDGGKIKDTKIKLLLSSRTEMQKVIELARQQALNMQTILQMSSISSLPTGVPQMVQPVTSSQLMQQTSVLGGSQALSSVSTAHTQLLQSVGNPQLLQDARVQGQIVAPSQSIQLPGTQVMQSMGPQVMQSLGETVQSVVANIRQSSTEQVIPAGSQTMDIQCSIPQIMLQPPRSQTISSGSPLIQSSGMNFLQQSDSHIVGVPPTLPPNKAVSSHMIASSQNHTKEQTVNNSAKGTEEDNSKGDDLRDESKDRSSSSSRSRSHSRERRSHRDRYRHRNRGRDHRRHRDRSDSEKSSDDDRDRRSRSRDHYYKQSRVKDKKSRDQINRERESRDPRMKDKRRENEKRKSDEKLPRDGQGKDSRFKPIPETNSKAEVMNQELSRFPVVMDMQQEDIKNQDNRFKMAFHPRPVSNTVAQGKSVSNNKLGTNDSQFTSSDVKSVDPKTNTQNTLSDCPPSDPRLNNWMPAMPLNWPPTKQWPGIEDKNSDSNKPSDIEAQSGHANVYFSSQNKTDVMSEMKNSPLNNKQLQQPQLLQHPSQLMIQQHMQLQSPQMTGQMQPQQISQPLQFSSTQYSQQQHHQLPPPQLSNRPQQQQQQPQLPNQLLQHQPQLSNQSPSQPQQQHQPQLSNQLLQQQLPYQQLQSQHHQQIMPNLSVQQQQHGQLLPQQQQQQQQQGSSNQSFGNASSFGMLPPPQFFNNFPPPNPNFSGYPSFSGNEKPVSTSGNTSDISNSAAINTKETTLRPPLLPKPLEEHISNYNTDESQSTNKRSSHNRPSMYGTNSPSSFNNAYPYSLSNDEPSHSRPQGPPLHESSNKTYDSSYGKEFESNNYSRSYNPSSTPFSEKRMVNSRFGSTMREDTLDKYNKEPQQSILQKVRKSFEEKYQGRLFRLNSGNREPCGNMNSMDSGKFNQHEMLDDSSIHQRIRRNYDEKQNFTPRFNSDPRLKNYNNYSKTARFSDLGNEKFGKRPYPENIRMNDTEMTMNRYTNEQKNTNEFRSFDENSCLEIRNLPQNTSANDLRRFFTSVIIIGSGIKFVKDNRGNKTDMAYVKCINHSQKLQALRMNGKFLKGTPVEVLHLDDEKFDAAIDAEPCIRQYLKMYNIPQNMTKHDISSLFIDTPCDIVLSNNNQYYTVFLKFKDDITGRRVYSNKSKIHINGRPVSIEPCTEKEFNVAKTSFNGDDGENIFNETDMNPNFGSYNRPFDDKTYQKPMAINCVLLKGFLPEVATHKDILEFFSTINIIPSKINIVFDSNGIPTGNVYCEFANEKDAEISISNNKAQYKKCLITVERMPKEKINLHSNRMDGPERRTVLPLLKPPIHTVTPSPEAFGRPGCVVGLQNVPFSANVEEIIDFFYNFHVRREDVIRRYDSQGKPTGDARVQLPSPMDVQRAIKQLSNKTIRRRPITVFPVR